MKIKSRSFVLVILIAIIAVTSCGKTNGDLIDGNQNSPINAAKVSFSIWVQSSGIPYQNPRFEVLDNDGVYAHVNILVDLRESADSDWLENVAVIECRKVGDVWSCDRYIDFSLSDSQILELQQAFSLTATSAVKATESAATVVAETELMNTYSLANNAYNQQDWIKAAIVFGSIIQDQYNYKDVQEKYAEAKSKSGRLIFAYGYYNERNPGTVWEWKWSGEIQELFTLPPEVGNQDSFNRDFSINNNLSQIAYTAGPNAIWLIDINGDNNRLLIEFPEENYNFTSVLLSYSPDDSKLLYNAHNLGVIDIATGQFTPLCTQSVENGEINDVNHFEWSQTGDKILIYDDYFERLWIASPDGSKCSLLADISSYRFDFATWAPDSQRILWVDDDGIYETSLNGQTNVLSENICGVEGVYAWSPDHKYLALLKPLCENFQFFNILNPDEILRVDFPYDDYDINFLKWVP